MKRNTTTQHASTRSNVQEQTCQWERGSSARGAQHCPLSRTGYVHRRQTPVHCRRPQSESRCRRRCSFSLQQTYVTALQIKYSKGASVTARIGIGVGCGSGGRARRSTCGSRDWSGELGQRSYSKAAPTQLAHHALNCAPGHTLRQDRKPRHRLAKIHAAVAASGRCTHISPFIDGTATGAL